MSQPSGLVNMARAVAGALPFVSRGSTLPARTVTVSGLTIDPKNVAEYAAVTGLRFGDTVPLTYPFALTFPTMMSLVTSFDFPFAAMGSVHIENHITQHRPIKVTDKLDVAVRAENLREHRKGLLVDIITEINGKLGSTEWKGTDSEQFRNDWNSNLTTQLRNVAQALRDAQQKATKNAQDQENTSNSL